MSQPPPFCQRPNLHLTLRPLTGSPVSIANRSYSTPQSRSSFSTPTGTPSGTTGYSPFRSAGLKPPRPYSQLASPKGRRRNHRFRTSTYRHRLRWLVSNKTVWLTSLAVTLIIWWCTGGRQELDEVKLAASGIGMDFMQGRRMQDYQFFPASNPKIHVRLLHATALRHTKIESIPVDGHQLQIGYGRTAHFQVFSASLQLVCDHVLIAIRGLL